MIGWIALAIVVLAILILLLVTGGLLGRLREFDRVSQRVLAQQLNNAAALQAAVAPVQESVEQLQVRAVTTQERMKAAQEQIAAIKSAR